VAELDGVLLSRMLTTLTLAFHIIFATLGVGVPVMISLAEFIGIKKNDQHYNLLARRWARGFVVTVAVGVVTGTIIGLQLSLLWPSFMEVAGQLISLPLFMEVFAFFFEAIFLGIYLYTWDRFKKPIYHWLLSIPIFGGSILSSMFITVVNAFMNTPQGFTLEGRTLTGIDPIAAFFNPAAPTKIFHVATSAIMTSTMVLAAITAFMILKGRRGEYHKKALKLTMVTGLIFSFLTALDGDISAKFLAEYQPEKLAAAEWHFETEKGADLILFGTLNEQGEIKNAIRFPKMLSFLAYSDFNAEVTGLNETPEDERPPLIIHYFFDIMVTIGSYTLFISLVFVVLMVWKKGDPFKSWLLWPIVIAGPLAIIAIEAGWFLAEMGRQPWILRGYMKVAEAATTSNYVWLMLIFFFLLYGVLGTLTITVLRKIFKNNPAEAELEFRFKS
jgi:cytochrome d ubiquinol oxidase subunit I